MKKAHGCQYEEVCADTGYESLDNYLYLEENGQMSFIKPSNYEQKKTKKFKKQIGRVSFGIPKIKKNEKFSTGRMVKYMARERKRPAAEFEFCDRPSLIKLLF